MKETNTQKMIQEIVLKKHDIALRLRRIVVDPIESMNEEGAAEPVYFSNEGNANSEYLSQTRLLKQVFSNPWNDSEKTEDEQMAQINEHLEKISAVYVPMIKDIGSFYDRCIKKGCYFQDTPEGTEAENLMKKSRDKYKELCQDLLAIGKDAPKKKRIKVFNLLTCLQEALDEIHAYVAYDDEVSFSSYECSSDRKAFHDHVLLNITENINTHAFGTAKFSSLRVWEKKVKVSLTVSDSNYVISIYNNGEKFNGDYEKVFLDGYRHGEKKHSGHGMYSAKQTMQELGGDIAFSSARSPHYSTIYTLTLPR